MNAIKTSRGLSFAVIAGVYLTAAVLGIALFRLLPYPFWLSLLIADAAATVWTFGFSVLFGNASVYDPYWSVQPIVILAALAVKGPLTAAGVWLLIPVVVWGVRLTANWAITFHGLNGQDWRYTMLREKTGARYPFVNFFGIHLFPTLVVYLCVLPAALVMTSGAAANPGSVVGAAVCLSATLLQSAADRQMRRFRAGCTGGLIREGLWRYARHPNYLGEILMWWGVAIQAVSVMPQRFWLAAGAVVNTVMFLTISIPMADRRQSAKPGYERYRAETRSLLPIPRKT